MSGRGRSKRVNLHRKHKGPRQPVLQVLIAVRVFLGQRVNLQKKYDYPEMPRVRRAGPPEHRAAHVAPGPGAGCLRVALPAQVAYHALDA